VPIHNHDVPEGLLPAQPAAIFAARNSPIPGDFSEFRRLGLDHLERAEPEMGDDALRELRPNPANHV
jgi:hypothetical protein